VDNNNLGAILRARRKERKLTLPRLSSLAAVSAMQIGRIERQKCFPKRRTRRKLATPLGFGEVELMKLAGFKDACKDEATDMAEGKCPPHHFIINSQNVGVCRDCPEVRDFGRLLQREGFGVRSKSKNGGTKGKRGKGEATIAKIPASPRKSVAAKERWQDPEYRAKQTVAMKGRCHKKEELL